MPQLTTAERDRSISPYLDQRLRDWKLSDEFKHQPVPWSNLWGTLRDAVFARKGSEVAEIGTTWLSSLVAMRALRPFETAEVNRMGGAGGFVPSIWKSATLQDDTDVWSIPWSADTRVIYYWQDMLETAEVDLDHAFATPQDIRETFERLRTSGVEAPWAVRMGNFSNTLHHAASWIWAANGDFLDRKGKRTRFAEPEALRGILDFFQLYEFTPQDFHPESDQEILGLFAERRVACIIGGPWMLQSLRENLPEENLARFNLALPPGKPFVGGSNLTILDHIPFRDLKLAFNLIGRLMQVDEQAELGRRSAMMPVLESVLNNPPYTTDPQLQTLVQALRQGRPLPATSLWGMVEDRLEQTFTQTWGEITQRTPGEIEGIVTSNLEALARRMDGALAK